MRQKGLFGNSSASNRVLNVRKLLPPKCLTHRPKPDNSLLVKAPPDGKRCTESPFLDGLFAKYSAGGSIRSKWRFGLAILRRKAMSPDTSKQNKSVETDNGDAQESNSESITRSAAPPCAYIRVPKQATPPHNQVPPTSNHSTMNNRALLKSTIIAIGCYGILTLVLGGVQFSVKVREARRAG